MSLRNTSMQRNIYPVMVAVVGKCFIYFIENQEASSESSFRATSSFKNNSNWFVFDFALVELLLLDVAVMPVRPVIIHLRRWMPAE